MALAGLIGGALKGDARSLMALETTGIDDALLREAVGLVAGGSAGGAAIAVGQFAATIILRHARTSEGADLGALCTECLQLAATPGLPTNRQLLSAAAAAATRAGPEAALQVHAEAMRLARLGQLAEGGAPAASPLTALQLVHALAEEAGRAVVTSSVREALAGQGAEVFALLNSVLRGSGGERGVSGGLECLSQWAETLGVGMDAVLATEGLLLALCSLVASEDESVVDSLADCLEALLTRPFAGTPPTNPTTAVVVCAAGGRLVPLGAGAVRPESQPWRSNGAALSELGAAVAAQRPRFGDDQPMLHRRGMCRIAVAVAEVLVWDTAAAAAQGQPLLECLVGAASSRDRPTAAIAIEGLVPVRNLD